MGHRSILLRDLVTYMYKTVLLGQCYVIPCFKKNSLWLKTHEKDSLFFFAKDDFIETQNMFVNFDPKRF